MTRRPILAVVGSVLLTAALLGACGGGDEAEVPSDPVLALGQDVYKKNCAQCHGAKGGGGTAPKLAGVVAAQFPNIDDHIAVIRDGRQPGMPKFGDRLTPEQIEAVARWEREGF